MTESCQMCLSPRRVRKVESTYHTNGISDICPHSSPHLPALIPLGDRRRESITEKQTNHCVTSTVATTCQKNKKRDAYPC